eukprot:Skav221557  [mRNA]  locus=scaffold1376:209450:218083:- [translate_table: standard]
MGPGVQPLGHGRTRTPRMVQSIKPGEGVPDVVCVASSALGRCHPKDGASWRRMVLSPEKRRFPRMAWPQEAKTQTANLAQMANSAVETHRPSWQVERQSAEVHPENRDGHSVVQLQGHQALQDSCWHMTRELEAQSQGPGPADKAELQDITTPEMRFSRFFTALMYHGPPEAGKSDAAFASHLQRFKFSILDGGKSVFSSGHYFEVKVMSLFQSVSAADRPKVCEIYGRTAGIVLGFKGARPDEDDQLAKDASSVANSWCISSNGWFFSQKGRPNPQLHRPTSQASDWDQGPWVPCATDTTLGGSKVSTTNLTCRCIVFVA